MPEQHEDAVFFEPLCHLLVNFDSLADLSKPRARENFRTMAAGGSPFEKPLYVWEAPFHTDDKSLSAGRVVIFVQAASLTSNAVSKRCKGKSLWILVVLRLVDHDGILAGVIGRMPLFGPRGMPVENILFRELGDVVHPVHPRVAQPSVLKQKEGQKRVPHR